MKFLKRKQDRPVVLGVLRISMGWIFLWAFFDKVFGLGFATEYGKAWIHGGSPTTGFLTFGTKGPFASLFQSLAGVAVVDWLFMVGLLCIGVALMLGVAMKLATYSGSLLLFLMWLAALLPEHNPIMDDHIVYIFVLFLLLKLDAGKTFGFGTWWHSRAIVQKQRWLR